MECRPTRRSSLQCRQSSEGSHCIDEYHSGVIGSVKCEPQRFIEPGDCVLAYSDGVVEAANPSGEMLGFEGLQKIIQSTPADEDMIASIKQYLAEFRKGEEQSDDTTILEVSMKPFKQVTSEENGVVLPPERPHGLGQPVWSCKMRHFGTSTQFPSSCMS